MNRVTFGVTSLLLFPILAFATTWHVPSQYPTIQAGINAATDGDTVLVAPGTYTEQVDFLGKEIVVRSSAGPSVTNIFWYSSGNVVTFNSGEGSGAVLEGFTISNLNSTIVGWLCGVYCGANSSPVIRGNLIKDNGNVWSSGSGVMVSQSSPIIEGNEITLNECAYIGAGMRLHECPQVVIQNNVISLNYTWSGYGVAKGGGIYSENSSALIQGNLIVNNVCDPPYGQAGGGIAIEGTGQYQILNNTFSGNESVMPGMNSGGGLYLSGPMMAMVYNNIVVNSLGGGISSNPQGTAPVILDFNDVWNNDPFNYYGTQPGNYSLSLNPQFVGGSPYSYELTASSPGLNAGAFTTDPDPDGTRADVGCYPYDQAGMHVALVADNFPIYISAVGGSFGYTLHLTNHTTNTTVFDVWIQAVLPDSSVVGPLILRQGLSFAPQEQYERHIVQNVPGGAPTGNYTYRARVGFYFTGTIYYEAYLPFTKAGTTNGSGSWTLTQGLDALATINSITPAPAANFDLRVNPNPFNPSTVARYQIPDARYVSLRVYDTAGRLVAALVDGWKEAGTHEAAFDGSGLSSGLYFAELKGGDYHQVQKVVLMK